MQLEIQDIHKFYGEGENRIEVLKGITANVEEGRICVLLGPSGSGKSTLLNIIGGIETYGRRGCLLPGYSGSGICGKCSVKQLQ